MTYFLRLTGFLESLENIEQAARYIERLFSLSTEERKAFLDRISTQGHQVTYEGELRRALDTILAEVSAVKSVTSRFRSDPFVFTGSGSTEEVLDRLEQAFTGRRFPRPGSSRTREGPTQPRLLDVPVPAGGPGNGATVSMRKERPESGENPKPAQSQGG